MASQCLKALVYMWCLLMCLPSTRSGAELHGEPEKEIDEKEIEVQGMFLLQCTFIEKWLSC